MYEVYICRVNCFLIGGEWHFQTIASTLPSDGIGDVRRSVYVHTTFGVRTYDVRCTHVQRSAYAHTAFGVRHRQNGKRRRNGREDDLVCSIPDR